MDKNDFIKFENINVEEDSISIRVKGEATNMDTKAHSFTLVVGFYDEDNKLVGVVNGIVNNIPASATKAFEAQALNFYKKYSRYSAQVEILIE